MSDKSNEIFILSPIGIPGSNERKHVDDVFDLIVTPAAQSTGHVAVRADQVAAPGMITEQIFSHILNSRLCIAVLTYANPNVYYELAVAHCFDVPTILLLSEGEQIPFDVKDMRVIFYDIQDARRVKEELDAQAIAAQIQCLGTDVDSIHNPVKSSIGIQLLKQQAAISDNENMGRLVEWVSRIDSKVDKLLGLKHNATSSGLKNHQENLKKCIDSALKKNLPTYSDDQIGDMIKAVGAELALNDVLSSTSREMYMQARMLLRTERHSRELKAAQGLPRL